MRKKISMVFILSLVFLGKGFVATAFAQAPVKLRQFQAWAVYSYMADGKRICYALSMPIDAQPKTVKHGDNFFLVSRFPGDPTNFEPQFMADYPLRLDSKVRVQIDNKKFTFFTKNASAWLSSVAEEKQLIEAMRKGSHMQLQAYSKRGTRTSYTFSLKGISAALKAAEQCGR